MPFEGRTAIVTGGASGIGLAISEAFVAKGTKVAIFDVNAELLEEQVERLRTDGGGTVNGYVVDVSNRTAVHDAVEQVRADLGPILYLINNAGITQYAKFTEITDEQWDRMMAINLRGPFMLCQEVFPDMKEANWGRIVNISSSSAQGGQERMAAYVSSKSGVIGLTKALALEVGRFGITVNHVPPGMVATPMMQASIDGGNWTASLETFAKMTPVRRAGEPTDMSNAVLWLCDDASSYVTGQLIGVNGGRRID